MYKLANVMLVGLPWIGYKILGKPTPTQKEGVENRIYDIHASVHLETFGASEKEFWKGIEMLWDHSSFPCTEDFERSRPRIIELCTRPFGFKMSLNSVGAALADKLHGRGTFRIETQVRNTGPLVWFPQLNRLVGDHQVWCHDCHDITDEWMPHHCCECEGNNTVPIRTVNPTTLLVIDKAIAKGPSDTPRNIRAPQYATVRGH